MRHSYSILSGEYHTVKWSHNGNWIASTSSDGTIRIWDANTGDALQVIQAHEGGGRSIDFSFDDYVLASKGRDNTIKLWKTDTWELIHTIDEPTDSSIEATPDVAFHPFQMTLAYVSGDDTEVKIWDVSTEYYESTEITADTFICPYCLTIQVIGAGTDCIECKQDVPKKYIESSITTKPKIILYVGARGHGKTSYLQSLLSQLENMGKVAQRSYVEYLDRDTLEFMRTTLSISEGSSFPSAQVLEQSSNLYSPLILKINNLIGDNTTEILVIYELDIDRADSLINQYQPNLLRNFTATWFVYAPIQSDISLAESIHSFINLLNRYAVNVSQRQFVLIYTKADRLTNTLPQEIRDYLAYDPYSSLPSLAVKDAREVPFNFERYVNNLLPISDMLSTFTEMDVNSGLSASNILESYSVATHYCITSVAGFEIGSITDPKPLQSYRIIDPLLLTLLQAKNTGDDTDTNIEYISYAVYARLAMEAEVAMIGEHFKVNLHIRNHPFKGATQISVSNPQQELIVSIRSNTFKVFGNTKYTLPHDFVSDLDIEVMGLNVGKGTLEVDFFEAYALIETIEHSIALTMNEANIDRWKMLTSSMDSEVSSSAMQPDIALRIYILPLDQSKTGYRFYLIANSGLSYLDLEGRSLGYRDVPKQLIIEIQERFSKAITNGASDDELKQIGKLIWLELLPLDLHRLYNNLSPVGNNKPDLGVRSIMIITDDEPWIPYELAVPRNKALCEEFEITRWVDGLGQARRANFPLGPVQVIQDANIASAIPPYDVLQWSEIEGMLEPRIASDYVDNRIRGYHYIRSSGDLEGKATDITTFLSGTNFSEFLRSKAAELQAKTPLVTISTYSTSANKAIITDDNYLEFIRSGAAVVVGAWWSTDPKDDRVFYRVLYEALSQGKILGESVSKARNVVRISSDHKSAHLAYFAIGDPMAMGYQLQEGIGYLEIKPIEPIQDESLQIGKTYTFRATLRREVPVHNNGIIAKIQPWDKPPFSLHIEAPRCEVTVNPDPIQTLPAIVIWEFSLEPKTKGRSTIYADVLRDDGTPFMEVHREEIEINGISNVSVVKPARSEPAQIFVDVTDKSESYSLNNKRYLYKNIPSMRSLKRLVEDTIDHLLHPDALSSHTHKVYDILSQIMHEPWWENVDKDTSLLLIDTVYSLPWEMTPHYKSHWGTDFIIGHAQPNFAQISNKEYRIQKIATLLDQKFEPLFTELQNEYELHCVRALDHLPPTPILNTSEALLNDICQRTRTRTIHVFAQATDNNLNIQLDANYSLTFDRHISETTKSKLKGFPIIILTVQSASDSLIDLTPYAYKLLSLGAGAVITPICTLPIEVQTQFAKSLYQHMFASDTINLGDIITRTRRHLLETPNSLHYLGFVLFGDPTLRLQFPRELQNTTS
ncbi:MAG: hypothetical protein Phog2KO_49720 [Phototrophicaceae bacterium]